MTCSIRTRPTVAQRGQVVLSGTSGMVAHPGRDTSTPNRHLQTELVKVGLARLTVVEDEMRLLRANLVDGSTP